MKNKKRKVAFYSPYLKILGGGENYMLTIGKTLEKDFDVEIFGDKKLKKKLSERFNLDLENIPFYSDYKAKNLNQSLKEKNIETFFYMTDGSVFYPETKQNFLIIQSPAHIPKPTISNLLKLMQWTPICYSQFMRKIIKKRIFRNAYILSPCIKIRKKPSIPRRKDNLILSVGRFFAKPHNKKHDVLISVFKKNYKQYFRGWRLVITGGLTEKSGLKIFSRLQSQIGDYPIELYANVPFKRLQDLYKRAKIYWHATGYDEDLTNHPEKAEHFGMTTLEAMANGAVPIVFEGGGQKDIVNDKKNGFLWKDKNKLIRFTKLLIKDKNKLKKISKKAASDASSYSCSSFYEKIKPLIDKK